jgi:hypothetical protein
METSDMIGSVEACRRVGVTAPTLRKRIRRGDLPVYLDPFDDRRRLIRLSDLESLRKPIPARQEEVAGVSAS